MKRIIIGSILILRTLMVFGADMPELIHGIRFGETISHIFSMGVYEPARELDSITEKIPDGTTMVEYQLNGNRILLGLVEVPGIGIQSIIVLQEPGGESYEDWFNGMVSRFGAPISDNNNGGVAMWATDDNGIIIISYGDRIRMEMYLTKEAIADSFNRI